MFTNTAISALFIILAVVVFIILCYKNVHCGIASIIAAIIAAFGCGDDFYVSIFENYTSGVASLVSMMFFIFVFCGILSYLMDCTGASKSIGNQVTKWLGADHAWLAITAVAVLLMLAGVGTYIYVVAVVAPPLMQASNLPRKVGMIAAAGIAPAINFCMPVPNVPGSIANAYLGTSIFSAPLLSIATGLVGIVLFALYMRHMVKSARNNGEVYDGEIVESVEQDNGHADEKLPGFAISVIPMIVVIVAAVALSNVDLTYDNWSTDLVAVAQLIGILVFIGLHFNKVKEIGITNILTKGGTQMWPMLVMMGCIYGFGSVVTNAACVEPLQEIILNLDLSPYISAMVSVALIAALCTDGVSAMLIWLPLFSETYLDMGVNAGALRRLLLCTTQTFDSLPHAQNTAATLGMFGLTIKEGYKDMFVTTVLIPVCFSVFCCICCIVFY